mmetsp:Transcript_5425/g.14652  ORF Transcript_5425/g.14652 Transcript_5425/m.14652 type:complete len:203 (-) Transcript_5425:89-697(-)
MIVQGSPLFMSNSSASRLYFSTPNRFKMAQGSSFCRSTPAEVTSKKRARFPPLAFIAPAAMLMRLALASQSVGRGPLLPFHRSEGKAVVPVAHTMASMSPKRLPTAVGSFRSACTTCRFGPYPSRALALLGRATAFTLKPRSMSLAHTSWPTPPVAPATSTVAPGSRVPARTTNLCPLLFTGTLLASLFGLVLLGLRFARDF